MKRKIKRTLLAVCMSGVLLFQSVPLATDGLAVRQDEAVNEMVSVAPPAEAWATQVYARLDSVMDCPSFIDFTGTFSGLIGSAERFTADFNETSDFARLADASFLNAEMTVQLNALYELFQWGVRDVDRWLEEVYIDISYYLGRYGDFMVRLGAGNEDHLFYAVIDGAMVQIEPNIIFNPPEVDAIRQALLIPHSMAFLVPSVECENLASIAPLSTPGVLFPRTRVNNTFINPFNAIVHINRVVWPREPRSHATGFLVRNNRTIVTAAHALVMAAGYNPPQYARDFELTLALNGNSNLGRVNFLDPNTQSLFVPVQFMANRYHNYDYGVIFLRHGAFTQATNVLRLAPAGMPRQNRVQTAGFSSRTHMYHTHGIVSNLRRPQNPNEFIIYMYSARGMSGAPILDTLTGEVVGILTGEANPFFNSSLYLTRAVRFTYAFHWMVHEAGYG